MRKIPEMNPWLFGACLGALLTACGTVDGPKTAGTATETENVGASIRNPGGTPAANVKVRFYPVGCDPRTGGLAKVSARVDSAVTDSNGHYAAILDSGLYNILAVGDSGRLYLDSIRASKDSAIRPPADTLKAAGSLKGVIRMQPGDDARTVIILVLGTNTFVSPTDSAGNFTLSSMARGTYSLRILTILDAYGVLDTTIDITAGADIVMEDTIILPYRGVPVPGGFTVQWDSLQLSAVLSWNALDTSLAAGYNVYRCYVGQLPTGQPLNASLIVPSKYVDTSCATDTAYVYYVKAQSRNGNASRAYSFGDTVKTAQAYRLTKTISISQFWTMDLTPLAVNNANVFIVNNRDTCVVVVDTVGSIVRSFGRASPGKLISPWNIRICNKLVCVGDQSDTNDGMSEPYPTGRIKFFTLQGVFIDSLNIGLTIQINMGMYDGGDYYVTPAGDLFFTNGMRIWRIRKNGVRDSIVFPLNPAITIYPKLEFSNGRLITASGMHSSDGTINRCQFATIDTGTLAVIDLDSTALWYRSMCVDTAGRLYVAKGQSIVSINNPDMSPYAKFNMPSSIYWDIAVDLDGSMYLYDYPNSSVLRFVRR